MYLRCDASSIYRRVHMRILLMSYCEIVIISNEPVYEPGIHCILVLYLYRSRFLIFHIKQYTWRLRVRPTCYLLCTRKASVTARIKCILCLLVAFTLALSSA